uniref:Uncharacterized protein n=1 Tax=Octopus bimaculoides TaxID=37653 RepID=A0A0L8GQM8_OCTBM
MLVPVKYFYFSVIVDNLDRRAKTMFRTFATHTLIGQLMQVMPILNICILINIYSKAMGRTGSVWEEFVA